MTIDGSIDPLPNKLDLSEEQANVATAIIRFVSSSLAYSPRLVDPSSRPDIKSESHAASETLAQRGGTVTADQALMIRTICEQSLFGTLGPIVQVLAQELGLSDKDLVIFMRGIAATLGSRKSQVLAEVIAFVAPTSPQQP